MKLSVRSLPLNEVLARAVRLALGALDTVGIGAWLVTNYRRAARRFLLHPASSNSLISPYAHTSKKQRQPA